MTSKYSMEEIDAFNSMVERASSASDVRAIIEQLLEWRAEGRFYWQNNELTLFLRGMEGAVEAFDETQPLGEYGEILKKGPWRLMAEVLSMALVLD